MAQAALEEADALCTQLREESIQAGAVIRDLQRTISDLQGEVLQLRHRPSAAEKLIQAAQATFDM